MFPYSAFLLTLTRFVLGYTLCSTYCTCMQGLTVDDLYVKVPAAISPSINCAECSAYTTFFTLSKMKYMKKILDNSYELYYCS